MMKLRIILFLCICFFLLPQETQANYFTDFYEGLEEFSELPAQMNQLKKSYEQTYNDLNDAKKSIQAYEQQTAQLMEQNSQLAETVQLLKESEKARQSRFSQIKNIVIWAIALALGYFVLTRSIRFVMRRSNKW
jgi:small-conductance mechanosensitive channel